jgi:hypothetical protein
MTLKKGKSRATFSSNVSEIMHSYKKRHKIGKSKPSSKKKALKQALAIAYSKQRSS